MPILWDNGSHWPSWQTPDDGSGIQYMGEGGGCFGVDSALIDEVGEANSEADAVVINSTNKRTVAQWGVLFLLSSQIYS